MDGCTVSESSKDGILTGSTATIRNTVVTACDRGVCAWGDTQLINCTLDNNRQGAVEHVGTLTIRNSIVAHSLQVGVLHDYGTEHVTTTYSNVWNPNAANYTGTPDKTGQNGNISADPKLLIGISLITDRNFDPGGNNPTAVDCTRPRSIAIEGERGPCCPATPDTLRHSGR